MTYIYSWWSGKYTQFLHKLDSYLPSSLNVYTSERYRHKYIYGYVYTFFSLLLVGFYPGHELAAQFNFSMVWTALILYIIYKAHLTFKMSQIFSFIAHRTSFERKNHVKSDKNAPRMTSKGIFWSKIRWFYLKEVQHSLMLYILDASFVFVPVVRRQKHVGLPIQRHLWDQLDIFVL